MSWRLLYASLCSLILYALVGHYVAVGHNATSRPVTSDFYKLYLSGQRALNGESMYWVPPPRSQTGDACHPDTPDDKRQAMMPPANRLNLGGDFPCLGPNLNPPIFMLAMIPLSSLPYAAAWWTWSCLSALCILLSAWLLTRFEKNQFHRAYLTLIGSTAALAFYPTIANFSLGQLGSFLLLPLTCAWINLSRNSHIRAAFWLGLAMAFKPFLGLLVFGMLCMKRWRVVFATLTFATLFTAAGVAIFGWTASMDYLNLASNVTWTATNWNASFIGFVDRAFVDRGAPPDTWRPISPRLLGWAGVTSILIAWGWHMRKVHQRSAESADAALFCVGLPISLLASPLGWMYYFPTLLLSAFVSWEQGKFDQTRRWPMIGTGMALMAAMVPITLQSTPTPKNPPDWMGIDSWYFYTLAGFSLAMAASFRRSARP